MKIGIFPKIIEPYKDQIEFSVDFDCPARNIAPRTLPSELL